MEDSSDEDSSNDHSPSQEEDISNDSPLPTLQNVDTHLSTRQSTQLSRRRRHKGQSDAHITEG